jgi:hypothetical protein
VSYPTYIVEFVEHLLLFVERLGDHGPCLFGRGAGDTQSLGQVNKICERFKKYQNVI